MRTETYNTLRQNSLDQIAWANTRLNTWSSDPVGIGTTLTAECSHHVNETVQFIKEAVDSIRTHTDVIAKLDELHGV